MKYVCNVVIMYGCIISAVFNMPKLFYMYKGSQH